jgi:hypothetical protein
MASAAPHYAVFRRINVAIMHAFNTALWGRLMHGISDRAFGVVRMQAKTVVIVCS